MTLEQNKKPAHDKSDAEEALTVNLMLKPIKPFLAKPEVTEVTINEPGGIYVKGFGDWEYHKVEALTEKHIKMLMTAVFAYNN